MSIQCALVNLQTGLVENIIMADTIDPVEEHQTLIPDPPSWVQIGDRWDAGRFVNPHALRTIKGAEFL